MAIDYDLTLAGSPPVERVAERAFPEHGERPVGTAPLLSAALPGFGVTVLAGAAAYLDVATDQGSWEWEPATYVTIGFRLDKLTDRSRAVIDMLTVVRRVLASGPEDAALVLNGDILLLTRLDGILTKHHRDTWWSNYAGADDLIRG